ncbi:MAG: polyprenyl synthetase family protein [Saprospiraceae bacterium]|nr:polyprenyl synthetase family protein [Saprospiraceae bacterium]
MFEKYLDNNPLTRKPVNLYGPADYIISLGGKRLRPVFVLLGYSLYKDNIEYSLEAGRAVEVFHNFTLLHDDIMDKAEIRRGKPTVHIKYNTNTAILTGDVMMVHALQCILNYNEPILVKRLLDVFTKMAFEVCEGQQLDMDFESKTDVTIEEYLEMITLKTSVLLATSIQMGAILGGADEADQKHLYEFAKNFGIAFQLQDDVLDTFGEAAQVGKRIGGDILQNKKTYLYLKSIELASDSQKAKLFELYSSEVGVVEQEKINAVKSIYDDVLIREYARQVIEAYRDLSISHLQACKINQSQKESISSFINDIIFRKN